MEKLIKVSISEDDIEPNKQRLEGKAKKELTEDICPATLAVLLMK